MSHDPHFTYPGYSPSQVLFDGCSQCETDSRSPWLAISHMDRQRFEAAWTRAVEFEQGLVDDNSAAETPVLRVLAAVAGQLEQRGFPLSPCPYPFDVAAVSS